MSAETMDETGRERPAGSDLNAVARIVRGAPLSAPPGATVELEIGQRPAESPRVGAYELIGRFASGASNHVYLAHKMSPLGPIRRAVLKVASRDERGFERARDLLLDEAQAVAFLDHGNIVKLLDVVDEPDRVFIALEYVPGPDLRRVQKTLADRATHLSTALTCYITREILTALDHAHRAVGADGRPLGIVHRDVNPSNVILSAEGDVKLTDFGMVFMRGRLQEPTAPRMVKGKFRYLAPEYISRQKLTPQVDVYGVGLILYELLSGEYCFHAKSDAQDIMRSIVKEGLDLAPLLVCEPPRPLVDIVQRSTAREPSERYATAHAMRVALEAYMAGAEYVSPSTLSEFLIREDIPTG